MGLKGIVTGILINIFCNGLSAQQNDFEGVLFYKTELKSKKPGVNEKDFRAMLSLAENSAAYIKQGNYKHSSNLRETYYISKNQKVYYKFKNIDTLYYLDYGSDTSTVLNVIKSDEQKQVAGLTCKTITIQTASSSSKYYYSPELHMNPEFDKNNKIGRHDVYTRETESLWLSLLQEAESYSYTQTCVRIEPKSIDDLVFDLPSLPVKEFSAVQLFKAPEFTRAGGWGKYLQTNLNALLGAKYIKIPKGEDEATQTVQVNFLVSERGEILHVKVTNKDKVHPKLAEEAIRVVSESRGWKAATVYGEKINFYFNQPVTFSVSKE